MHLVHPTWHSPCLCPALSLLEKKKCHHVKMINQGIHRSANEGCQTPRALAMPRHPQIQSLRVEVDALLGVFPVGTAHKDCLSRARACSTASSILKMGGEPRVKTRRHSLLLWPSYHWHKVASTSKAVQNTISKYLANQSICINLCHLTLKRGTVVNNS